MDIKFSNVSYYYDKKSKILDSINLKIKKNTILGITGKSGSGKTILVELMTGLIVPTSGKVIIDDITINKKKAFDDEKLKNLVSYLPQNNEIHFFYKTVKEEIMCPFKFLKKEISEQKLIDTLKFVDLDESFLDRNPLTLSNGEKQKVSLVSTLILDTDIIILDEPSKCLDYKSKRNLERTLKNLKNNFNKTIVVISRDVEFLHKISDDIVILNEGKVLLEGNKYDVFKNIDVLKNYNLPIPKTIEFSNIVLNKKNIKIGYRDEINDLLKDIYRYVK